MSNISEYENKLVEHNFFATIGDYNTRNTTADGAYTPDNATKIPFTQIGSNNILRTANAQFDHVMVNGLPLSASRCLYQTGINKFNDENGNRQTMKYFYALNIISIDDVSNQTINDEERLAQQNDAKLYINLWNARRYLNVVEFEVTATPKNLITLFGVAMATGRYRELIFNKTSFTINSVEEFKEVPFNNNLVSVGRIGNKYYLIVTNETNP